MPHVGDAGLPEQHHLLPVQRLQPADELHEPEDEQLHGARRQAHGATRPPHAAAAARAVHNTTAADQV